MSQPFTPPLFKPDEVDNWKKYLEDEGFVVISDILQPNQYITGLELFKKDMSIVSPRFDFNNSNTWNINTCPIMFGKGMGIFNGFGQSDFMWHIRTNSTVQSIFKSVYSTNDLVTSFDGFSMFVSKSQKSKSWLHIDQNPANQMYSVQSAYNYYPVKDYRDAGFVLVPKSHKTYKPSVSGNKDWFVCPDQPLADSRKLIIPANCLVLWNSKTIHANEGMRKPEVEFNRLTCYVSFQPKHLRPQSIYEKRLTAYKNGSATSHYANKCELKRYPFGFKTRYESRGFKQIEPKLNHSLEHEETNFNIASAIPSERLILF
jgi:hypothetical protein